MRLSEDRINSIASKIAFQLVKKRQIKTSKRLHQVTAWVEKPMLEDLALEQMVDDEVRAYIEGLSKGPPEGSFEYNALFDKKKEEIARRRGLSA